MTDLIKEIAKGEDSSRQFKSDIHKAASLASEMAAFANSEGGIIYIGVADDGSIPGLSSQDVSRINQLISNAASQLIRSPLIVQTKNISQPDGRIVIELTVPKGMDKPYFDKNGVLWLKTGSDKRRINTKEELKRLFQLTSQFHADELPSKAGLDALDTLRLRDFLQDVYQWIYPDSQEELLKLLNNMDIAGPDGHLTLAGVLLFSEHPEWIEPAFTVKAIRYPGTDIHETHYEDMEDFSGPLPKIYENSLAFITRNLRKIQGTGGVNDPGKPEIPIVVFEELLVNALIHRDYLVSAAIRMFIFDDRIEIHSPGHLPNNLTVDRIRAGISNIRNPVLASFVAKGILPYRGLGSGIKRALEAWPEIDFIDDREACLFTVVIRKKFGRNDGKKAKKFGENKKSSVKTQESSVKSDKKFGENIKSSEKTDQRIIDLISQNPEITIPNLSEELGVTTRAIEKQLKKLQDRNRLRRVGPKKSGHWEVFD